MIVAITGKKYSGKSLLSSYIKKKYAFKHEEFAKPIKDIAQIFGFKECEVCGTPSEKEKVNEILGISGRQFMQRFGTEIGRNLIADITGLDCGESKNPWVKIMENKIRGFGYNYIVIDDLRFLDEARMIKKNGGYIIRVIRETNEYKKDEHKSEQEMNEIIPDWQIFNTGNKGELYNQIDNFFNRLGIMPSRARHPS